MARLDFSDTLPIDARRLATHLAAQGFAEQAPGRWKRGGVLGAWLGFTPRSWPAEVTVAGGVLRLTVRAGGQILTRAESAFWQQEWDSLCAAAAGQHVDTTAIERQRDVSLVENTLILAMPFPISALAAALVGVLAGIWAAVATFAAGIVVLYVLGVGWLMVRAE